MSLQSFEVRLTNVQQVSDFIQHQVSIVSIFKLKKETKNAVASHARDEIATGLWRKINS